MTHTLACALCSNDPTSAPTSPWTVAAYLAVGVIVALVALANAGRRKAGRPPIQTPVQRMSPAARSLLSGRNIPAYTAPVRARTPSGTLVRHGRCCLAGHQVPEQAVAHAAAVAQRIAVHGR